MIGEEEVPDALSLNIEKHGYIRIEIFIRQRPEKGNTKGEACIERKKIEEDMGKKER